eukprot:Skav222931  [mRNA]  locus=scaffold1489:410545:415363:+ [translate_table: standard]
MPELAFGEIAQRAEQVLAGKAAWLRFPGLGLEKCDAKRFRWEIPDGSGKHYSLSLWKLVAAGEAIQIPICESLVGGIAVKASNSTPAAANPGKMIEKLAELVGESNVLMALQKLSEKGLDFLGQNEEHFTDAWIALMEPLDQAAKGHFSDSKQVISFVQVALEVYQKLD